MQEENVIPLVGTKNTIQGIRERLMQTAKDMDKLRKDNITIEFSIAPEPKTGRMMLTHFRAFRIEELG